MKRCYDSGAAKQKKRERMANGSGKQRNSFGAFISRRDVNDQNAMNSEDIQDNSYYNQSLAK